MSSMCRTVLDELRAGRPLVSVVLYSHKGSTPRTAGARLLVYADGRSSGTVGGGRYEAEALTAARALQTLSTGTTSAFNGLSPAEFLEYSLRGVTDMDMICGGELSLLLQRLDPDDQTVALYERAAGAEDAGRAFSLRTHLTLPECGKARVIRREFSENAETAGLLSTETSAPRLVMGGGTCILVEPFARRRRLFLFGAGHVSRALATLADMLEYRIVVLEDRADFASSERFPTARLLVLPDQRTDTLRAALETMHPAADDAAVILTRGHAHDRDALHAVLDFAFGYIGMIGSRPKRDAVYAQLREEYGVAPERLKAVHCPVGLDIGAQTPEEIAVSIAGELIAKRTGKGLKALF